MSCRGSNFQTRTDQFVMDPIFLVCIALSKMLMSLHLDLMPSLELKTSSCVAQSLRRWSDSQGLIGVSELSQFSIHEVHVTDLTVFDFSHAP